MPKDIHPTALFGGLFLWLPLRAFPSRILHQTARSRAWSQPKRCCWCRIAPRERRILHPILHRKSTGFIGVFFVWCRKCRFFSKTFFEKRDVVWQPVSFLVLHVARFGGESSWASFTSVKGIMCAVCYNYRYRRSVFLLFIALCLMQTPTGVMV